MIDCGLQILFIRSSDDSLSFELVCWWDEGKYSIKGNHARLTRRSASWSVIIDVYNYCSAESAEVTVEPVQDKLDKLPHTPIPVLHQGTTEQSHNNQSFIVAKQPACI